MKEKIIIQNKARLLRFIAALLMCGCLLLLTGINFIVYDLGGQTTSLQQPADNNEQDDRAAEKPVEEKSSTGSISMQEEYVHDLHTQHDSFVGINMLNYCLLGEAKLSIVHFDLISPPPDL